MLAPRLARSILLRVPRRAVHGTAYYPTSSHPHPAQQQHEQDLPSTSPFRPPPPPLTEQQKAMIAAMLRVDQAGELGANWIYAGQMAVFKSDPKVGPVVQHMWDQEKFHLSTFDHLIGHNRVRPTALRPLWEFAGYALGAGTALLGKEAAMACTEAVETVIGQHYNDQLRELLKINHPEVEKLRAVIKQFRDEELEHLDTALDHDAKNVSRVATGDDAREAREQEWVYTHASSPFVWSCNPDNGRHL